MLEAESVMDVAGHQERQPSVSAASNHPDESDQPDEPAAEANVAADAGEAGARQVTPMDVDQPGQCLHSESSLQS